MTYYMIRCIEGAELRDVVSACDPEDAAAVVMALAQQAPRGTRYEVSKHEVMR